jgi:hypothetical protein
VLTASSRPFSQAVIFRIGQGVARIADEATAFSYRDADYLFHPISMTGRIAISLSQAGVAAARGRHSRAELGPHETVADRNQCSHHAAGACVARLIDTFVALMWLVLLTRTLDL